MVRPEKSRDAVKMAKQIDIGINSEIVNDVLNFLDSRKLFKNRNLSKTRVINDFDEASELAWEKYYGEDEYNWSDIKSHEISKVKGKLYKLDEYSKISVHFSKVLDFIDNSVRKQLDKQHSELLDEIVSDFNACIYSRVVTGKNNKFFEEIFSIYQKGYSFFESI